jgi:hypothetical protein
VSTEITLNDGQFAIFERFGNKVVHCYDFPSGVKVTRITVIFNDDKTYINNLIFFFENGQKMKLGWDEHVGRKESYTLAPNENLIGAKFEHGEYNVLTMTFLTIKYYL